jgi:AmmeMemoRadiSam system protein B/AmmeMemoRadiSam system protein A
MRLLFLLTMAPAALAAAFWGPVPLGAGEQIGGRLAAAAPVEGAMPMNAISLQFVEYRGDPEELARRVDRMLEEAPAPARADDPAAIVVPHAGYRYSGPIAAYAYNAVRDRNYGTVVVIGPSHRVPFQGISILDAESFQSPLGAIPCDRGLIASLLESHENIAYLPEAHSDEHSLEVQVPFLQRSLKNFKLVMAVIGGHDPGAEEAFTGLLAEKAAAGGLLLVASSDWSHYKNYDLANLMDRLTLRSVLALDSEGLNRDIRSRKAELCGLRPVLSVISAVHRMGVREGVLLRHANSGDTAGPKDAVVGYAAIAFYRESGGGEKGSGRLDEASKKELLALARKAIEGAVNTGRAPEPETANPALRNPQGAFVTIKINGKLRGCIGNFGIRDAKPLYRTVSDMAVAAAVQDPRFPPLSKRELPMIELEISALTPLTPLDDAEKIEVGRHGLHITKGFRSGVLLPQVASEYGWDRVTFLEQTCRKAGLGPDEWKEGSSISTFEAEIFSEKDGLQSPG